MGSKESKPDTIEMDWIRLFQEKKLERRREKPPDFIWGRGYNGKLVWLKKPAGFGL